MLPEDKKIQLENDLDILFKLAEESSQNRLKKHPGYFNLSSLKLTPAVASSSAKAMIDISKNSFFQKQGLSVPDAYDMQKSAAQLKAVVEIVKARKDIKKRPEALEVCERIINTLNELTGNTLSDAHRSAPRKK